MVTWCVRHYGIATQVVSKFITLANICTVNTGKVKYMKLTISNYCVVQIILLIAHLTQKLKTYPTIEA
jgi:hypothetical protein